MKRVLLTITILFSYILGFSQNFEKSLANSDKQIQDPKRKEQARTWVDRGNIFQEIANAPTKGVLRGSSIISSALGKEIETINELIGDTDYSVKVYNDKKIYFDTAKVVVAWKVNKYFVEDPMEKAYDAYMHAITLDVDKKETNKIITALTDLSNSTKEEGSCALELSDYQNALKYFELSLSCSSNPLVGVVDSAIIYYLGIISTDQKDYDKAEKYLKRTIEIDYDTKGEAYARLGEVLGILNKSDESLKFLQEGYIKHHENESLLIALINIYVEKGRDPKEILPLLHAVQKTQPTNPTLYLTEAQLYEKIGEIAKAEELYLKAVEVDPNYFFGYYALGILRFNTGVQYQDQAGKLGLSAPQEEYNALVKLSDEHFEKALIPFLKAHELQPKEKSVLQALKDIYLKYRGKSPEYEAQSDKFKELYDAVE